MQRPGKALERLRGTTDAAHRELEADACVVERLRSPSDRDDLLGRYRAMHSAAEVALRGWIAEVEGLDELRHALRSSAPGNDTGSISVSAPATISNLPQALGFLYAIAGSALGGRVILRQMQKQGVETATMEILNPYGASVGAVWRALLAVLEREVAADPVLLSQAEIGALRGFAHARAYLCNSGPGTSFNDDETATGLADVPYMKCG